MAFMSKDLRGRIERARTGARVPTRGWIARAREMARRRGRGLSDDLARTPIQPRELVRYGKPRIKEWNRPMSTYERANSVGLARQLYRNVDQGFLYEAPSPFEKPDELMTIGDIAQAQPSFWESLTQTATELFKTREARKTEEARAKAEQARAEAAKIPSMVSAGIESYWPYIALGGGALLLFTMLRRR